MKAQLSSSVRTAVKFRMPTSENLVPIRLDIEIDEHRYKDAFTWNPSDPDSEVVVFAKRTVKDLKLPPAFITQIAQSIQAQLAEFRSYEGQDMYTGEKIVPIKLDLRVNHTLVKDQFLWDLNNFESDPEEFARAFCKDLGIEDLEVGPAIAFAIREQLYEIAIQSVATAKENRLSKKGRRGTEHVHASKSGGTTADLMKLFNNRYSMVRSVNSIAHSLAQASNLVSDKTFWGWNPPHCLKRKEWDVYEPVVDLLSNEELDVLEAKEERSAR